MKPNRCYLFQILWQNPIVETIERWLSVMRHSDMSSAMLEEMVSASKGLNIYDRLSERLLDSLLDIELADRGINSPYQFGVRDMEIAPDSLIFSNAPRLSQTDY